MQQQRRRRSTANNVNISPKLSTIVNNYNSQDRRDVKLVDKQKSERIFQNGKEKEKKDDDSNERSDDSKITKFLKDMEDENIRNDYIAVVDAHVTELLDSVKGKEKKKKTKSSTTTQIADSRDKKVDLTSPDSIFVQTDLKDIINISTFQSLPLFYQYKLVQMLPKMDQTRTSDGWIKLNSTALKNEFFNRASKSWCERLKEGKLTPEFLLKRKNEMTKERAKLDPWKARHFERVWGETVESQKIIDSELDRIPKTYLIYNNCSSNESHSRSSSSCSFHCENESSVQDKPIKEVAGSELKNSVLKSMLKRPRFNENRDKTEERNLLTEVNVIDGSESHEIESVSKSCSSIQIDSLPNSARDLLKNTSLDSPQSLNRDQIEDISDEVSSKDLPKLKFKSRLKDSTQSPFLFIEDASSDCVINRISNEVLETINIEEATFIESASDESEKLPNRIEGSDVENLSCGKDAVVDLNSGQFVIKEEFVDSKESESLYTKVRVTEIENKNKEDSSQCPSIVPKVHTIVIPGFPCKEDKESVKRKLPNKRNLIDSQTNDKEKPLYICQKMVAQTANNKLFYISNHGKIHHLTQYEMGITEVSPNRSDVPCIDNWSSDLEEVDNREINHSTSVIVSNCDLKKGSTKKHANFNHSSIQNIKIGESEVEEILKNSSLTILKAPTSDNNGLEGEMPIIKDSCCIPLPYKLPDGITIIPHSGNNTNEVPVISTSTSDNRDWLLTNSVELSVETSIGSSLAAPINNPINIIGNSTNLFEQSDSGDCFNNSSTLSTYCGEIARIPSQITVIPLSPTHIASTQDNGDCPCNLKALVICTKCGAFCHHDCVSQTKVCVTCLVR